MFNQSEPIWPARPFFTSGPGSSSEGKTAREKEKEKIADPRTPAEPKNKKKPTPPVDRPSNSERLKQMATPPPTLPSDATELHITFELPAHVKERARCIADAGTTCITVSDMFNTKPGARDSLKHFIQTELPALRDVNVLFKLQEPVDHGETKNQLKLVLGQLLSVYNVCGLMLNASVMWDPKHKAAVNDEQGSKIMALFKPLAAAQGITLAGL